MTKHRKTKTHDGRKGLQKPFIKKVNWFCPNLNQGFDNEADARQACADKAENRE